jgi:hypothetical protein
LAEQNDRKTGTNAYAQKSSKTYQEVLGADGATISISEEFAID